MRISDEDKTPTQPWSVGIQIAELCAAELCGLLGKSEPPPGMVSIIAEWSRRTVTRALAPERAEVERLRAELAVAQSRIAELSRHLAVARNAMRTQQ